MNEKKYSCSCCGYLTLEEEGDGTYELCPVCYWENDELQNNNHDFEGGANKESLCPTRKNYKKFGAASYCFISMVRPPFSEEIP